MPVIFSASAAFSSSCATALDKDYHDYHDYCDYCDYRDYRDYLDSPVPPPWTKIILHFPHIVLIPVQKGRCTPILAVL